MSSILSKAVAVGEAELPLKACIYGEPGVGKTVFAAGAPSPLIIDTEHGSRSLLNHKELRNVPVLTIDKFEDVMDIFWELKDGAMPEIKTIIIDSISELQKRQMDEILKEASVKDRNRNPYLPFQADYKLNTEILRRLVVSFRELDRNLVIIAHSTEQVEEADGRIYLRPAVTPKLAGTLFGIMDLVGYLSLDLKKDGTEERTLQIKPSRRVQAKSRLNIESGILKNPKFSHLLQAERLMEVDLSTEVEGNQTAASDGAD